MAPCIVEHYRLACFSAFQDSLSRLPCSRLSPHVKLPWRGNEGNQTSSTLLLSNKVHRSRRRIDPVAVSVTTAIPSNGEPLEASTSSSENALHMARTDAWIREVAGVQPPDLLRLLLRSLCLKGEEVTAPSQRRGMVPLAIPLTRNLQTEEVTALLRWPTAPEGMQMPLVKIAVNGGVALMSRTIEEYLLRLLAEEDGGGGPGPMAAIAREEGRGDLYEAGTFAASGIPRMDAYLTKKVGLFPDVLERLVEGHLERGDQVSALVTSEFYALRNHFPGFGSPLVFNASLLQRVGREAEARDAARMALRSPWWTLGCPFQEMADMAGFGEAQLEYMRERLSEEGRRLDLQKGKAAAQISLDHAAFLLDLASVEGEWEANREELAALYQDGGLCQMASFVLATD
eukprot:TRINITY_DN5066_c0_g1_i1.p1 TRINITY_DN5066_c0_g1~~TRINITY_DN5066_c0_g1_i1.p1  ORF type:complete len:401 (+),score=67.40 TRINITY_DN5066_c0_g1_i1:110-1312(+)